jgi:putative ABC transport system ATP-binding protein
MISLREVRRYFTVGDQLVRALDDVTLEIAQGDYVSIMGPSGSGKSTLLHIIGLLDRPTSGAYWLNKHHVTALSDNEQTRLRRDKIGFVFQFFHLVPRLSAAENIELPLILAGVHPSERKVRVQQALTTFGLTDRTNHRPDQLSGGQRQRVAIARATIMEPAVLLADEPTGNLDRASGRDILAVLEALNRQGLTLLMVTHDPELGARAARELHMVDGRIARDERRRSVP